MSFYLRTLGQLTLHPEGPDAESVLSESKSLVILALLAVTPDHTMARDHLSELLWPGTDHQKARRSLRQSLYYLTQRAEAELTDSENGHVRLQTDAFDCDLWELDRAIQANDHETVADGFTGRFLESLERKLGRELSEWVDLQNQRLRSARRDAHGRLIERSLTQGHRDEAIRYARGYAARNPLDEDAQLQLIQTLKHVGDEAGAFRAYEEYRTLVRSAVQDEPSDEIEKAVESVRQVLLADREWKPIAADPEPEALTAATASRWALWLVAAGAVLGVGATSVAFALNGEPPPPPNSTLDNLSARIVVGVVGESDYHDLVLEQDETRIKPTQLPSYRGEAGIPSPGGTRTAYRIAGPDGIDAYLSEGNQEPRPIFSGPGDQEAVAWSPDGKQVVVVLGEIDANGAYEESVAIYDIGRDQLGPTLATYRNALEPLVWWSPDGTRLAIAEDGGGQYDLRVVSVDGRQEWPIAVTEAQVGHAAWSPDGRSLTYTSDAPGVSKLFVYSFDDGVSRQLTEGPEAEATPTWLSDKIMLFTRQGDGGGDAWALDLETGDTQQMTDCGCLVQLAWAMSTSPGTAGEWIEEVEVVPPPVVVPGDTLKLDGSIVWSGGRIEPLADVDLAWHSTDSSVAKPLPDDGVVIESPGDVDLILSAGGWRADTVQIASRTLVRKALHPAFTEDWTDSIRSTHWHVFGDPLPYSRPDGGPEGGGVFINNGDRHWSSGVASKLPINTRDGLTVEAWGRLPSPGELHQSWGISLLSKPVTLPRDRRTLPTRLLQLTVFGHRNRIELNYGGPKLTVPRPEPPQSWHRYAVQLDSDGTVSLFVDDQLLTRRLNLIDPTWIPSEIYLALGWRSVGAEVLHGDVRVYEDLLYERFR